MVVAVATVGMVQPTIDQEIHVISVRHRLVSATRPMLMAVFVGTSLVGRCTAVRVPTGHLKGVFLHRAIGRGMMEVTVVKVVKVISMTDRGVPASVAMLVIMLIVKVGRAHKSSR
jgi:hypothetical protein